MKLIGSPLRVVCLRMNGSNASAPYTDQLDNKGESDIQDLPENRTISKGKAVDPPLYHHELVHSCDTHQYNI